jgi:glucose/mannose-6-phosphate isomerase
MSSIKKLTEAFPLHLKEAINIGKEAKLSATTKAISNVLICGMGGSGIGGSIISQIVSEKASIPFLVCKDYSIPAFVGNNTLVIASSYSGSTEETLSAVEKAMQKGAEVVCLSSGGRLIEIAKEKKLNYIQIPGNMPPRAAFGYSFPQLFYILTHYKILDYSYISEIENVVEFLHKENENILNTAEKVSTTLFNKTPVLYADASFEAVLIRFRQQLNENAKILAWHHTFPEMNHNELVGWKNENKSLAVLLIRNETDYFRTAKRMDICKEIIGSKSASFTEIWSKGNNTIERILYLIHLLDYVSVFLAEKRNIDAEEIEVINFLKGELSKF